MNQPAAMSGLGSTTQTLQLLPCQYTMSKMTFTWIRRSFSLGGLGLHRQVSVCASKGFGASTARKRTDDDEPADKPRGRRIRQQLPTQQQRQEQAFTAAIDIQKSAAEEQEAAEFAARLQQLKAQGQSQKSSVPQQNTASQPSASAPSAGPGPKLAAFDAPTESIYDNPPSLQETVLSSLNSDISDPKLKNAQFGPSQIGIAVSAVIFGLVFVLVAGGDFAPNNRFKGVRPARDAPDSVELGIIKTRISNIEQQLQQQPNDLELTQALALSYAQLYDFDKAAGLLDKVVARQPNNADAYRLLGETALLGEQAQRAVKAYEKAVTLRNDDLQIATGMTDAYIATGQYAKAVSYLQELRPRAPTVTALGVVAVDAAQTSTSIPDSTETVPAPDAAGEQQRSAAIRPLEPVGIELLLAKTYSVWRGHDSDALATYDAVIARFPEDFRAYLAKGVFLRDKGRRADAERMFLQAKFYAPENRQRFVKEQAQTKPIVDLPENN